MDSGVKSQLPPSTPGEGAPSRVTGTDSPAKKPWGLLPPQSAPSCSLATVMDEELARKLQEEEEKEAIGKTRPSPAILSMEELPSDTSDDLLLAQMLQFEFDREHDKYLRAKENHTNKNSRVKVSLENFRSLPPSSLLEDESTGEEEIRTREEEEEEEEEEEAEKEITEERRKKVSPSRGKRRSKGVPQGVPTKHDPIICGHKNVRNLEKFPPSFLCGDIGDDRHDYRLPNSVYNSLRVHSHKEEKHAQRLHEKKEHSTQEQALDEKTRLLLFKMVDGGLLTEVNGCVSTGKEACIYHAGGGSSEEFEVPSECAIKVYKTTLNEFKNRDRYIKDDYRFKDRFGKQNPRKLVKLWAEKEMHNLKRLRSGGVACPDVVLLRKHVLVMSFIGQDQRPAPKVKELRLPPEQMREIYQQCIQGMKRMYSDCKLIHADLSEYNILWHNSRVYFIDVGQSVEPSHPNGLEFLLRDCKNISGFFSRSGVRDCMDPYELFNSVSGLGLSAGSDKEFIVQIQTHTKRIQLSELVHSKTQPYAFDYFFEQTTATPKATPTSTSTSGQQQHHSTTPRGHGHQSEHRSSGAQCDSDSSTCSSSSSSDEDDEDEEK